MAAAGGGAGVERSHAALLEAELRAGFSTFLGTMVGIDPVEARAVLARGGVDFARMAHQARFFGMRDYVAPLNATGTLGRENEAALFGAHARVEYAGLNAFRRHRSVTQGRGFSAERGWALDGQSADLGPVNGPLPLQELVRALSTWSPRWRPEPGVQSRSVRGFLFRRPVIRRSSSFGVLRLGREGSACSAAKGSP